jgi:hypothetical protein
MAVFQAKVLGIERQPSKLEGVDDVVVVALEADGLGKVNVPIQSWPGGERTAKLWEGKIVTISGAMNGPKLKVKPLRAV